MSVTASTKTPYKRKAKDLPGGLADLTESTFRKVMKFQLETDPNEAVEAMVAYEVAFGSDGREDDSATCIQLDKLTADQLRRLCKNVGVQYVNSCTKFACRKALWVNANLLETKEKDGARISTAIERATSNTVRLVNVIFSSSFYNNFLKLNDIMKRAAHEAGGLPSDFWGDVTEALNGDSDDDPSPLQTVVDPNDPHVDDLMHLDLEEFDNMTTSVIRKKFHLLLKVRNVMKVNMTTSGEHDNDAYNFVDVAMKKVPGASTLTKIGCYYFFLRCTEKKQEIDDTFGSTMDPELMGNTHSPLEDSSITDSFPTTVARVDTTKKRAYYEAVVDMSGGIGTMATQFVHTNVIATKSANALEDQNRIAIEKNRLLEQGQRIQLAQFLGDTTMLRNILSSIPAPATPPPGEHDG
jgi:hypothetical protein